MPLITHTPPSHTQVTAKAAAQYVRAEAGTVLARMKTAHAELCRRAWRGQAYSPADFFTAMGTDGIEVLIALNALATAINSIRPDTIPPEQIGTPEGINVTMTDDGTVTVV